ncbi:hypothetical protein ACJX0J_018399, partial [Zea mays]
MNKALENWVLEENFAKRLEGWACYGGKLETENGMWQEIIYKNIFMANVFTIAISKEDRLSQNQEIVGFLKNLYVNFSESCFDFQATPNMIYWKLNLFGIVGDEGNIENVITDTNDEYRATHVLFNTLMIEKWHWIQPHTGTGGFP